MKNIINLLRTTMLVLLPILVFSCVHDDDYDIPEIVIAEPDVLVNTDIASIKAMYRGYEPVIIETGSGSQQPMFLEAYVISSDEAGNYYKQLVIQDSPENPSTGIVISTEATDMYTRFNLGRKVYVRVDGLYIGKYAGLVSLGTQNGREIGRINVDDFEARVLRSTEAFELVPTKVTIPQALEAERISTLIQLDSVQFPENLAGLGYGNFTNTFGVNRIVEDCFENQIILRNSGFSDFKNELLPLGKGSLTAIVSVFNSDFQLFIRDLNDVDMQGDRCVEVIP